MASFAIERLQTERKNWRTDHPPGFVAKPHTNKNGQMDLFNWDCLIPGLANTPWEGGYFPLQLSYPNTYPEDPPIAIFKPPLPHVNVFPSGRVCLSILDKENWKPSLNLRQVLLGIQNMLNDPNPKSPASEIPYTNYMCNRTLYEAIIREHVTRWKSPTLP